MHDIDTVPRPLHSLAQSIQSAVKTNHDQRILVGIPGVIKSQSPLPSLRFLAVQDTEWLIVKLRCVEHLAALSTGMTRIIHPRTSISWRIHINPITFLSVPRPALKIAHI